MKTLKKSLAVLLSFIMIFGCSFSVFAENIIAPSDDSKFYTQGDYSIHYKVIEGQGEKKGRIMFVHGFIYSGSTWNGAAEIMAEQGYDCYLIDLPNYGYSTRENADTNLIAREDLVVNLMKSVAPLDEWILAGHSMGGGIAMNIACDYPELKALMLFCPSEINLNGGKMMDIFNSSKFLQKITTSVMNAVLRNKFIVKAAVFFVTKDIKYAKQYNTDILTTPLLIDGTIPGIFYSTANARHTDLEAIAKITVPTMLVWADGDNVINSTMKKNITGALASAEVHTVKGSHIVIETNPKEIADLSLSFLSGND